MIYYCKKIIYFQQIYFSYEGKQGLIPADTKQTHIKRLKAPEHVCFSTGVYIKQH